MTAKEVKAVQAALNAFTTERLKGVAPLIVDGDKGAATDKRIRECKWFLGFKVPTGAGVTKKLIPQLAHPRRVRLFPSREYVTRGVARRAKQRLRYRQQLLAATVAPGVGRYDGVPVAVWLIPYLEYARKNGWQGRLVSGWRSPAYSESLCYRMCGAPSCPGRCAGKSSNHSGSSKPAGAVDVSDYVRFGQLMAKRRGDPKIFNALGAQDPVHFSASGR